MKKIFSIALSVLMLATMMHVSFDTHYCSGKEIAVKVSLTGKLACCGMTECGSEGSGKGLPLTGENMNSHCCDDIVSVCGIDNNYEPSYSFVPESFQYNFPAYSVPAGFSLMSGADIIPLLTDGSPPHGEFITTHVDLTSICVFRI